MAKSIKCILYGCTSWGHEMLGRRFNSLSEAHKVAKENVENGYWFSYRLERI